MGGEKMPSKSKTLQDIPTLLLVGGLGERLRAVVEGKPKPLARIGRESFLGLLVRQLRHQGIHRLIMCTGYLSEQVETEFGDGCELGVVIDYSREECRLGTGGAIKLAASRLGDAGEFIVMNGDSFLDLDLSELLHFHRQVGALVTMSTARAKTVGRYGTVNVGSDRRVIGFTEKSGLDDPGWINGGVYAFNRAALGFFPDGPSSLEKDVFPRLVDRGLFAFEVRGFFLDIGTPEDYALAQQLCDRLYEAAEPRFGAGLK